jgi:hypothetical protein
VSQPATKATFSMGYLFARLSVFFVMHLALIGAALALVRI